MIKDENGNLNVIASIISNNNRVVMIKDLPMQFRIDVVNRKTRDVIVRINRMINNQLSNNIDNSVIIKENGIKNSNKFVGSIKKNIDGFFNNGKFVYNRLSSLVLILILVFSCITVGKTFSLRDKVNDYDKFFVDIENKQDVEVKVYHESGDLGGFDGNGAASLLVDCINSSIDVNNLPDSISLIVDELNKFYNSSNNYFAFKYKDIYTGFSISYNEEQNIFAASTIKAPKDIYIYEMASNGLIDLDEEIVYTGNYYNNGTGILKDKEIGGKYNIRTLVEYSTVHSDNAAHNMLMDKYGRDNMLEFWKDKGTNVIFNSNDNWGLINAHDASIYMDELYKFYLEDSEYGGELMNNFINSTTKFIVGKNNYKVANKSGWSGSAMHDVSIVFADNPYIVVGLSNLGDTDDYWEYFNKINDLAYRIHTEYWKYKMSVCENINQY